MKLSVVLSAAAATAFVCDADEFAQYDIQALTGIYQASVVHDTPPSKTSVVWSFGVCEPLKNTQCADGSELCGVTEITLDKKTYVSQIISVTDKERVAYKPITNSGKHNDENGLLVSYEGVKYGDSEIDATIKLLCPGPNQKEDEDFTVDKWDGTTLKISRTTKAACVQDKSKKPKPKPEDPQDSGESWGWFTWIFIFFVLFLSVYIIGGAWFQYNRGNSIDFQTALKEVLDNFVDIVRGLPTFVREIIERFTGNSNRGEYSAV